MRVEGNALVKSGRAQPMMTVEEMPIREHNPHASRSGKSIWQRSAHYRACPSLSASHPKRWIGSSTKVILAGDLRETSVFPGFDAFHKLGQWQGVPL
jgi:hypothetical protein